MPPAETGGIRLSNTVHKAIEGKLDFGFDFLAEQQVKNIAKPARVYRVGPGRGVHRLGRASPLASVAEFGRPAPPRRRHGMQ